MHTRWFGVDQLATRFLSDAEYQEHVDNIIRGESRSMIFKCPHCRSPSRVRTSREISELLRVAYFQCSNIVCGHVFKAHVEVVQTVSPSSRPNPGTAMLLARRKPTCFDQAPTEPERQRMVELEKQARIDAACQRLRQPDPL